MGRITRNFFKNLLYFYTGNGLTTVEFCDRMSTDRRREQVRASLTVAFLGSAAGKSRWNRGEAGLETNARERAF